jgi:uncharacterized membrane protein
MNAPRVDRVASIAAELGRLGRRLDDLGAELLTVQADAARFGPASPHPLVPQVGGVPPSGAPTAQSASSEPAYSDSAPGAPDAGAQYPGSLYPGPPYPGASYPGTSYPGPPYPGAPGAWPGRHGPLPYPPPAVTQPRSLRDRLVSLSGARLVAWTGAAVTLLGVVLLLALAAARGWFAPPVRVGAGAVLGLGLVGLGLRLHRRVTSRVGALAVTGTGIATLYLVVAAATALYGYLPVPVGLLLALLVAAGGLGLADRWRAALLGTGAVVGAALLAPVVTDPPTPLLVALVLVLQVAATVVALRRSWLVLIGVAAAWPVLYGTLVAGLALPPDRWATAAVAAAVLVLGVTGAGWVGLGTSPEAATTTGPSSAATPALLPRGLRIGLVVAAPVPALTSAATVAGWAGAALAFIAAVLLFAAATLPGRDRVFRIVALAAGAVALFEATAVAFDGDVRTAVILGQGLVLLVVAGVLRSRPTLVVAGVFATAGVLSALGVQVPPSALAAYPAAPFVLGTTVQTSALLAAVTMSALVLATAVAALVASGRVGLLAADARASRLWAPVGLVGLYGLAGLVIALALLVSPSRSGFVAGHAVVTVSWTLVALVLLARGIRRPALRVAGLVLVAAAVAKLVFFDLVALDGLARVAAFLGAGLLLLAAGTRYARLVAEADAEAGTESEPATVPPARART